MDNSTLVESFFKYKKDKTGNSLRYIERCDQFLRVFVQFLILFVQKTLVNLSKYVQSVVHVCSKNRAVI
jgi:hypothetical protein